jgi:glyoxylate/hydroxypyruvate reductase A
MAILVNNHRGETRPWVDALAACLPEFELHSYPAIPSNADIEYAVVWHHPHGDLMNYPNLKAILILGAGMDHIDKELELPDVPIVRLLDPAVGDEMSQYVLYWVMHFQRGYERYRQQANAKQWRRFKTPLAREYRVSVLGAGEIGRYVSERLALNGFVSQNWSRSKKVIDQVQSFYADDGLETMLASTDTLVNCLPLADSTHHFLDADKLSMLPKGCSIINISRGAVIDDTALLRLLDSGHIVAAALDTFALEPLADESHYWQHDKVFITPHMSGATYPSLSSQVIADNIRRVENGDIPFPIYTRPSNQELG